MNINEMKIRKRIDKQSLIAAKIAATLKNECPTMIDALGTIELVKYGLLKFPDKEKD